MGLKETIDKAVDAVKDTLESAKDAASEAAHRGAAESEAASRDLAGDHMTLGEKVGSVGNQIKHETEANIDAAKRAIRDNS
jgi:hypothetical protein